MAFVCAQKRSTPTNICLLHLGPTNLNTDHINLSSIKLDFIFPDIGKRKDISTIPGPSTKGFVQWSSRTHSSATGG